MKIAHLSVAEPFTARWVNSQVKQGHDVHLIMMRSEAEEAIDDNVAKYLLPFKKPWGYYLNAWYLRLLLRKIQPDLLHVHYATGHGTLGRLSRYHPSILSVWGSDIMTVPKRSRLMKRIVIKNLKYYDWICSTSKILANDTFELCPDLANLSITPIGVDTTVFCPKPEKRDDRYITIGTIKTLLPKYGIDILLRAFAEARKRIQVENPQLSEILRLLIVGGGPLRSEMEMLANKLGLNGIVEFTGQIPNHDVPEIFNKLDIFVAMSRCRSESFGVAVIEASACSLPVVVSNIGGLPEVTKNNITGFIVENENVLECANAIIKLIVDQNLREQMGEAGRQFVKDCYEWKHCMSLMNEIYKKVLERVSNKK